jgi:hypothetical protein
MSIESLAEDALYDAWRVLVLTSFDAHSPPADTDAESAMLVQLRVMMSGRPKQSLESPFHWLAPNHLRSGCCTCLPATHWRPKSFATN